MIREAFFLAAYDLPVWLLRLVFSVTLVCMAAFLATLVLRRFSAAMRHRVWALSVAASLAMPVMILWSPEVRLGWLTVPNPRAELTADIPKVAEAPTALSATELPRPIEVSKSDSHPSQPVAPFTKKDSSSKAAAAKRPLTAAVDNRRDSASEVPKIGLVIPTATQSAHVSLIDPTAFWLLILVIPAVCGIWQSLWAAYAIRRVVNEARPIQDAATRELIADVCHKLGWHRTLEMRQSNRTPVPLCVGWLRPCILVPSQWRNWGDLTLRAVLAHEVSHVVRRDVAWQFVARVACFLYWFHPLVWLAARKMRIERESACDDTVLGMVERPVDYASVLLRFAREMVARSVPSEAVAMAGLSGLEGRVRAILDKGRPRTPVGRGVGRLFAGAAILVAAGAASLSPLSRDIAGRAAANDSNSRKVGPHRLAGGTSAHVDSLLARAGELPWPDRSQPNGQSHAAAISGCVVLNAEPHHGMARAKILGIPENPKASYVTAVADAQGNFRVPRIRSAMLFLAQNESRTFSGIARIEPQESGVVIPVGRSVTAHGRLLDAAGKPLGSWPLEYCLVLDGSYLDEFHVAQSQDVKKLLGGMASTRANGEFWLTGLAPGWAYRITCCPGTVVNNQIQPFITIANFTPAQSEITQLGDVTRPRTQTMDDVFLNASSSPAQIEKVLEAATENAKMLDQRVLIVSGSPKNETFRAIHAILAVSSPVVWNPGPAATGSDEPKWSKDSYVQAALFNYSVVGLEVVGPGATTETFLRDHKLAMPAADDLVLTVLDPDGKIVAETSGRQLFAGKSPAARPLSDWLQKNAPKLPDAQKLLTNALKRATRENKLVFLRETAPQAGPYCTRLARYIEQYKDLIEKDYICLKIDVRCPNAEKVISGIRDYDFQGMSFPWMVILDGGGKPLASSTSPHGNIGAPMSAQEASYFAWMLRATAQRLTEEEVATLVLALTKDKT
jgi:beta-lactamase regulating signal transducer with metallopeptidase domain